MAHLEGAYEQISERLGGIDGRLTALDQKIDSRFDRLDEKIDQKISALDRKMDSRFDGFDKKLTAMMLGSFGTSAALVAAIIGVIVSHH